MQDTSKILILLLSTIILPTFADCILSDWNTDPFGILFNCHGILHLNTFRFTTFLFRSLASTISFFLHPFWDRILEFLCQQKAGPLLGTEVIRVFHTNVWDTIHIFQALISLMEHISRYGACFQHLIMIICLPFPHVSKDTIGVST